MQLQEWKDKSHDWTTRTDYDALNEKFHVCLSGLITSAIGDERKMSYDEAARLTSQAIFLDECHFRVVYKESEHLSSANIKLKDFKTLEKEFGLTWGSKSSHYIQNSKVLFGTGILGQLINAATAEDVTEANKEVLMRIKESMGREDIQDLLGRAASLGSQAFLVDGRSKVLTRYIATLPATPT